MGTSNKTEQMDTFVGLVDVEGKPAPMGKSNLRRQKKSWDAFSGLVSMEDPSIKQLSRRTQDLDRNAGLGSLFAGIGVGSKTVIYHSYKFRMRYWLHRSIQKPYGHDPVEYLNKPLK